MNDRVRLVKADGKEIGQVAAHVQRSRIFIEDAKLPIEEGDWLIRRLPSGLDECYLVLDRGLYSAVGGVQTHYQVQVRKVPCPPEQAEGGSESGTEGGMKHDSVTDGAQDPERDLRTVFVVHGRDEALRRSLFAFLRALGLKPLEWSELIGTTGEGSPYVGVVLKSAFATAQAVVVLLSPDDEVRLSPSLTSENDGLEETTVRLQARPNVLFEAGMALGSHEARTILVEVGQVKAFSDVGGRHVVRLDDTPEKRTDLARRLKEAGCPVSEEGTDWLTEGTFTISRTPNPRPSVETKAAPLDSLRLADDGMLWDGDDGPFCPRCAAQEIRGLVAKNPANGFWVCSACGHSPVGAPLPPGW